MLLAALFKPAIPGNGFHAIKWVNKSRLLIHRTTWVSLQRIMLSEKSQFPNAI